MIKIKKEMRYLKLTSNRSLFILGMLALMLLLVSFMWIDLEPKKRSENKLSLTNVVDTNREKTNKKIVNIDPKAEDILQVSMDYLSNLNKFSVKVQNTLEDLNEIGHRVDYEISSSIIVHRPNKLYAERHGNLYNQIFYYNGITLTQYNPNEKVYAMEQAPGTIEEMFHFARDTYGLGAPVSDLIYKDAFSLLMYSVNYATVIGKEMIGDVQCDHLLFSRPGVDFQIWIADKGEPLPYKYVVTDTATPELLAFTSYMRNWNIAPTVSKKLFEFEPPQGTKKIPFIKVDQNDTPKQ